MTLIKSISGIRGTIGGQSGEALTPLDIVKYTSAFGSWILENQENSSVPLKIVIGRDARISGSMVRDLVVSTLIGMGVHVIDLGLSTTPTVEMAVPLENAQGGIIITASHNPKQWNALKLLNSQGEFVSESAGLRILELAELGHTEFADIDHLGELEIKNSYLEIHIQSILNLPLVQKEAIKKAHFKVVVDAVNSTGGIFVPALLRALGVSEIIEINCHPDGHFTHNPEPLPGNLLELRDKVISTHSDLGIAIDPDVDRLVFINEDGSPFGEEYTLVAVSDYILSKELGNTVSNLSSTRALQDITEKHGGKYSASAVGEVHVVTKMKETHAVIGGEGNGGVIYPKLHYGRDALVGIALFLSHLAEVHLKASELRNSYPNYFLSKNKIDLKPGLLVDELLEKVKEKYKHQPISEVDGLRIDFEKQWVHLRKSNTEPIIRIYAESNTEAGAEALAGKIIEDIHQIIA